MNNLSVKVSGDTSLVEKVWIGEVAGGILLNVYCANKRNLIATTSSSEENRIIVITADPDFSDANVDTTAMCNVEIIIPEQNSCEYEIFVATEERYQFRCLFVKDAGKLIKDNTGKYVSDFVWTK